MPAINIIVQDLAGDTFTVSIPERSSVKVLKKAIEKERGVRSHRQQPFLIQTNQKDAGDVQQNADTLLRDDAVLSQSCLVLLCVTDAKPWQWDNTSPLLTGSGPEHEKVFNLVHHGVAANGSGYNQPETKGLEVFGSSIAQKISQVENT